MIGRGHDLSGSTRSNGRRTRSSWIKFVGYLPRQQLVDAIDLVVRDMSEHVFEVGSRVDVIELACSCRIPCYAERLGLMAIWSPQKRPRCRSYIVRVRHSRTLHNAVRNSSSLSLARYRPNGLPLVDLTLASAASLRAK